MGCMVGNELPIQVGHAAGALRSSGSRVFEIGRKSPIQVVGWRGPRPGKPRARISCRFKSAEGAERDPRSRPATALDQKEMTLPLYLQVMVSVGFRFALVRHSVEHCWELWPVVNALAPPEYVSEHP